MTGQAEHTPGPWSFRRNFDGSLNFFGEGGARLILSNVFLINREPNARLVSLAPTMYEYIRARAEAGDSEAAAILEAARA